MSDPKDQSPEDLERSIEETQQTLRRDMDALGAKMNPENVAHETGERVRESVSDGTRQAGNAVRKQLDRTFERIDERDDVAAWGLVGTVALIGIGLLLMRGGSRREEPGKDVPGRRRLEADRAESDWRSERDRVDAVEAARPSPMEG